MFKAIEGDWWHVYKTNSNESKWSFIGKVFFLTNRTKKSSAFGAVLHSRGLFCFSGSETIFSSAPITVREKDNVRLRCAATGYPRPVVQWRKLDKSTIGLGKWEGTI